MYYCKDYWHRVTTQLMLVITITIIIISQQVFSIPVTLALTICLNTSDQRIHGVFFLQIEESTSFAMANVEFIITKSLYYLYI